MVFHSISNLSSHSRREGSLYVVVAAVTHGTVPGFFQLCGCHGDLTIFPTVWARSVFVTAIRGSVYAAVSRQHCGRAFHRGATGIEIRSFERIPLLQANICMVCSAL